MASLTIKNIGERVLERLRAQARKRRLSLNAYLRLLLAHSVGLEPRLEKFNDLSDLAGTWSEQELKEFEANTSTFREIDESLWR